MNQIVLAGNLVADPELRYTQSGKAVSSFRIAVSYTEWRNGRSQSVTDGFFDSTAWNRLADNVVETFSKGSRMLVAGRLVQRTWTDGDDNRRTTVEILVSAIGAELSFATAEITKNSSADSLVAEDNEAS